MPIIRTFSLDDARLAPFSRMTDAELRDARQMVGLARAIDAQASKAAANVPASCEASGSKPSSREVPTSKPSNCKASANVPASCEEPVNAPASREAPMSAPANGTQQNRKPTRARSEDSAIANAAAASKPNANRLSNGLFIAESRNVIERALAASIRPFALLVEERWLDATRPLIDTLLANDPQLPVFVATREETRQLTGFERTRGALAAFHRPPLPNPRDLLKDARRVAVLEDVTNYTNIGAIFRSAAALGIDAVLITPACHDPFYRRAARVSMGAVFQVPWTRIGTTRAWAEEGLPLLHDLGFTTCALALSDNSVPLQDRRLQACEKLALVLGTEGDGLSATTIAHCDYTVRIPMDHDVDSLNVAAASAVAFWELRVGHRD